MTTKAAIEGVLTQKVLAVAGVSRDPNKFGLIAYKELKAKGFRVLAVNPKVDSVDGDPCYPTLKDLPEKPGALVIVTQPAVTEQLVHAAVEAGIRHIWLQQGAESPAALQFCQEQGLNAVSGECIMMYLPHASFPHGLHKFVKHAFGGRPK